MELIDKSKLTCVDVYTNINKTKKVKAVLLEDINNLPVYSVAKYINGEKIPIEGNKCDSDSNNLPRYTDEELLIILEDMSAYLGLSRTEKEVIQIICNKIEKNINSNE